MLSYLQGDYLRIASIQAVEEAFLLSRKNVIGIGIGQKQRQDKNTGQPCLQVYVTYKQDAAQLAREQSIPPHLGGYLTDVVETGAMFASGGIRPSFASPPPFSSTITSLRHRVRPVEGGFSIGHYQAKGGTMATAVIDASPMPGLIPRYYILSNNHVLANANNAAIGDPILQPGPVDGGKLPADVVAHLSRFIPLHFDGRPNLVDAALAEGEFHELDREIHSIGYVRRVLPPQLAQRVQKTGRTTNHTTGEIIGINATLKVQYGRQRTAKMCRQIVTTKMSAGGDSGSLLCDMHGSAVGMLCAVADKVTLYNDIRIVQEVLGIRLV